MLCVHACLAGTITSAHGSLVRLPGMASHRSGEASATHKAGPRDNPTCLCSLAHCMLAGKRRAHGM